MKKETVSETAEIPVSEKTKEEVTTTQPAVPVGEVTKEELAAKPVAEIKPDQPMPEKIPEAPKSRR